ncbi:transcription termination factor 5, mitochondrial [Stomoxys calcitrans]|uniref:transcription termination factor 5, mitochondrial n=1 Tax=Stomoxys calcitrans TaxID=35570 RepID=UPI0027E39482|nr:transcription termination factor 5, mitochondrial [Stomoxys calcitrans]
MFRQRFGSFMALLTRDVNYAARRFLSSANEMMDARLPQEDLGPNFFAKNIGSNFMRWQSILKKHPELKTLRSKDIINTNRILGKLSFTLEDILSKPMILYTNEMTIENRYIVLKECGFENITISLLSKFVSAMNRTIATLKSQNHIPFETDVVERLRGTFTDIELKLPAEWDQQVEEIHLKILRQRILNCYLQQKLMATPSDLEKIWKTYGRLRHKSFYSVQSIVDVLHNELKFSNERIIKNGFLLYGDAENVRRIIEEKPNIAGHNIRELLYKRPKIMMTSCDALLTTLKHIKHYGIGEDAILRCLEILTLGPDTVLERLKDLNEVEEFKVLSTNPRVLRLVHYQNKARLRLDYLNQLKVRCASLHILSCGSEAFAKFARDGSDRTKGRDNVVYLSKVMNKPENDLRNILSRHPNWCHIPATQVKNCYEYLLGKTFTTEDIYNNIHLLLYPIKRIQEKLKQLSDPDFLQVLKFDRSNKKLTKNESLTLVLYLIESEFHFTGDGLWTEQHTQHVENFNNLLPDFPESLNKMYKYGLKPLTSATISSKPQSDGKTNEYVFS